VGLDLFFYPESSSAYTCFFTWLHTVHHSGILLLTWCVIKKEKIWDWRVVKHAALSGVLMLFLGNGAVIWAEQSLPSSLVAVLVSAAPLWFVLLDKPKWKINFHSRPTLTGLVIGFAGVVMLFSESITKAFSSHNALQFAGLLILIIGSTSWAWRFIIC
jgi:drug/metabolite transporter (DMT)-like permease